MIWHLGVCFYNIYLRILLNLLPLNMNRFPPPHPRPSICNILRCKMDVYSPRQLTTVGKVIALSCSSSLAAVVCEKEVSSSHLRHSPLPSISSDVIRSQLHRRQRQTSDGKTSPSPSPSSFSGASLGHATSRRCLPVRPQGANMLSPSDTGLFDSPLTLSSGATLDDDSMQGRPSLKVNSIR